METMTWQEQQAADRAAREAAEKQSKADLRDLAHQLGAAKPGANGDNTWYVTMQHEGQEMTVCLSVPWYVTFPQQARRVTIEPAVWRDVPHYRSEDYAYYPSGTTPSERGHISVSLDQPAERIAREIKRRCLPFAAAEMETIKRNVERRRQRDSARATLAAAFIAASGGEPIPPERLARCICRGVAMSEKSYDVEYSCAGRAVFTVQASSAAEARRIVAAAVDAGTIEPDVEEIEWEEITSVTESAH